VGSTDKDSGRPHEPRCDTDAERHNASQRWANAADVRRTMAPGGGLEFMAEVERATGISLYNRSWMARASNWTNAAVCACERDGVDFDSSAAGVSGPPLSQRDARSEPRSDLRCREPQLH
jgi:hypothetical protein